MEIDLYISLLGKAGDKRTLQDCFCQLNYEFLKQVIFIDFQPAIWFVKIINVSYGVVCVLVLFIVFLFFLKRWDI